MTTKPGLLVLLTDPVLRDEVDRIAAAAGVRSINPARTTVGRKSWTAALAVVLDETAAQYCAEVGFPRRALVFVAVGSEPTAATYRAAMAVGARTVLLLPGAAAELVGALSTATESLQSDGVGAVLAVVGGKGGAGASVFAAALAHRAAESLLVDLDPGSGGIDLLLGLEGSAGLRWPDLALTHGRLSWSAVRQGLPQHRGISVLSTTRGGGELDDVSVAALIDAGRRGGATVICDLARRPSDAVEVAVDAADLVVVLCPSDIRSCAATATVAPALLAANPNVGVVVRGPAPGGLRAADVVDLTGLSLLAAMRPEAMLAEHLDRGGLRLRRRSPLTAAADRVLGALGSRPVAGRSVSAEAVA